MKTQTLTQAAPTVTTDADVVEMVDFLADHALYLKKQNLSDDVDFRWVGVIGEAIYETLWGAELTIAADCLDHVDSPARPTDALKEIVREASGDDYLDYAIVHAAVYDRLGLPMPETNLVPDY